MVVRMFQRLSKCRLVLRRTTLSNILMFNFIVLTINAAIYIYNKNAMSATAYFLSPLDQRYVDLLDGTFRAFVAAMQTANVTFFIFSGSLLGSVRHHGRIPWDDDIDVIINITDRHRVRDALSGYEPDSFGFYEERRGSATNSTYQWKFYPKEGHELFYKTYKYPFVDIFFYYENETHIWNGSPYFIEVEIWPKSHVFPLQRRPFGDLQVPAPCNVDAFLGKTFNVSVCQSRDVSHYFEIPFVCPVTVPCDQLSHLYPFVRRSFVTKNQTEKYIQETLMFQGVQLRQVVVQPSC